MKSLSTETGWLPIIGAFVAGTLLAQAPALTGLGGIDRSDWLVVVPFLISVGLFLVFTVLMILRTRSEMNIEAERNRQGLHERLGEADARLEGALSRARSEFRQHLDESRSVFRDSVERSVQGAEQRLQHHLDEITACVHASTRKDCQVVFEPDFEDRRTSRCYEALVPLVQGARRSIMVIPNPYTQGKLDTWELPPRARYLAAIEARVRAAKDDPDFEYLRFQQVKNLDADLAFQVGRSAVEHMLRIQAEGARENVRLRLIEQDHISGQLIIDGETLVKFISGVDCRGKKRLVAITIMRDPTSNAIEGYYQKLHKSLLDNGRPLTRQELEGVRAHG